MSEGKKRFLKDVRKLLLKGAALKSVILLWVIQQLVQVGRLMKMSVNGTGNLEFYQVVVGGKVTDMVLAILDGKAKLIPEIAVDDVKDENFTYSNGNFVTGCEGKMTCIEKLIMSKVTGQSLTQLMTLDVHHMWFRFCALPEMIKMMNHDDHVEGHKQIVNYARNQVVFIDSIEDWDEFIEVVMKYREILKEKTFSIEY